VGELLVVLVLLYLWGWSLEKKEQRWRRKHARTPNDVASATLAVEAQPCSTHVAHPSTNRESFGDGTYLVGVDINPGRYRARGVPGTQLEWARLRSAQGTDHDVIAGYQGSAPGLVEILNQDFAFWSQNSGGWHLVLEGTDKHSEVGYG
jgi:hypothetical protein